MKLATLPRPFAVRGRPLDIRMATGGGADLTEPSDPVNLVFFGDADPLRIRTALLSLPAERDLRWSALAGPRVRWRDAIGHVHTAYAAEGGWSASAVQLELGRYKGARAHLRLFAFEGFTLGAAHVEFLPTGAFEHQVVSWALGEELIVSELERAGVLRGRPERVGRLPTGLDRTIEPETLLRAPDRLVRLAGLPERSSVPVRIPGDGFVSALQLAPLPPAERERSWARVSLDISTSVPSPIPDTVPGLLPVEGPLRMEQELVTGSGKLSVRLAVRGVVSVGDGQVGRVRMGQVARLGAHRSRAALQSDYRLHPAGDDASPVWQRRVRTRVTSGREPQPRTGAHR